MLVERGVCPHFVYMYAERDVKCFAQSLRTQLKPERMRNMLSFRYNNVSFHERFQGSLRIKVRQLTELQLQCIMFQVFFTLAVLQQYIPRFRHNDLSLDNVLLNVYTPQPNSCIHYQVNGADYYVPDTGVFCAVTDFDLSHAPCMVQDRQGKQITLMNHLIAKDQFGNHEDEQARRINATDNPSFDTYYFLYRMADALRKPAAAHPGGAHAAMLSKIRGLGVLKDGVRYIDQGIPALTPARLLSNPIFALFRHKPPKHVAVLAHLNTAPPQGLRVVKPTGSLMPRRDQRRKVSLMNVLQNGQT